MLCIGGIRVKVKFYVLPEIYIDMILGCDILNQLGEIINFSDKKIHFSWNSIQPYKVPPCLGHLEGKKNKHDR